MPPAKLHSRPPPHHAMHFSTLRRSRVRSGVDASSDGVAFGREFVSRLIMVSLRVQSLRVKTAEPRKYSLFREFIALRLEGGADRKPERLAWFAQLIERAVE